MAGFRLGCSAIRWAREAQWEDILDEIKRIGYEGTEVQQAFQAGESTVRDVKAKLEARGLVGVTTYVGGAYHDKERASDALAKVRQACEMMAELGGEIVVVACGGSPERRAAAGALRPEEMLGDDELKVIAENLNRAGEICKEYHMTACLHNHAATFVEAPQEIDRLLELTSPDLLALNPDTGHLCVGEYDCVEFFHKYADRIKYVHLKSCNKAWLDQLRAERKGMDWFVKGEGWAELRDGCIDMKAVIEELKKANYDGWLMVEQDNSPNPPAVAAASNYAFLREVLQA